MSKNIKRIIAIAMAIGTISAVSPVTDANIFTTKAYASSDNDTDELDSLKLKTSDGSNIKLYSSSSYSSDDKVDSGDVKDDEAYFAKTSSSTINIDIDGPSNKFVKVFKGTSDSAKGKSITSDISLSSGSTTTLTVKVYSSTPDSDVEYSDDNDVTSTYVIKVKCTSDSSSSSDDNNDDDNSDSYDDIYLDKLSVNGDSISLSDSKTTYNYSVASDVDEATIKATPPDSDDDTYTVTIDGTSVDSSDKFKKSVDLKTGKNEITVKLKNDNDEKRVYTLNITRGSSSSDSTSSTSDTTTATSKPDTATTVSTAKASQWVQANGKWQYNDATGNPVKNSWVQNYYLQADGTMATGWLNYSNYWYYLGTDGAKKTGWQLVGGQWYYLDTAEGRMQTGWIKDIDGKYYYLNSNGTMACNTTINGYKLDSNGAWIGK